MAARPLRVWAGSTTPITIDFNPFHVDTTLFGTHGPIYEPLFFFNQLSADPPTPMIGESYAYSTDGKEVTIKLKAGLKWNDGQPLTADDVVFTLGYGRNNTDHLLKATNGQLQDRTVDLLERVALGAAYLNRRPHELSVGQRQRVAIARALAPGARIIIADEPVSMLDVSIRVGVLNLLADLQRADGLGVLYITHDLATARHFSDDIIVMLRGEIVERGPADEVILDPQHPYTASLREAAADPERLGRLRDGVRAEHAGRPR